MRERFQRFMVGRYGVDQFSRFLNAIVLILLVISIFIKVDILFWIAVVVMIYSYFRIFSRNTGKRYLENERFMRIFGRFTRGGGYNGGYNQYNGGYNQQGGYGQQNAYNRQNTYNNWKYKQEQKKIYKFFDCPQCKQKVRVPKGKGKICITCPKCRMEFVRRS